jgi:hypothetical protein
MGFQEYIAFTILVPCILSMGPQDLHYRNAKSNVQVHFTWPAGVLSDTLPKRLSIIIIIIIIMFLVTGLFFPVILLNQQWSPPLRLQASHCSTFRIMCDVPGTAVFCSESNECFPGTASRFFL